MKKSSFFISVSIMTLALIVAVVGVTAAWFGDVLEYRDPEGPINVSSANPKNNAIIVPDSTSGLPTGEDAVLAPARLKAGYGLTDVDGSGKYDSIEISVANEFGKNHPAIEKPAVPVTVTFDFVYNGAPSNDDGKTTRMKIELVSITLKNPTATDLNGDGVKDGEDARIFLQTNADYREEFGIEMFVTTTNGEVMIFPDTQGNKYYTEETKEEEVNGEITTTTYYQLRDVYHYYETENGLVSNPDKEDVINPYVVYFDIVPVIHTINATIHFLKVDEETSPELIGTQLFLNFEVSFLAKETTGENENQN